MTKTETASSSPGGSTIVGESLRAPVDYSYCCYCALRVAGRDTRQRCGEQRTNAAERGRQTRGFVCQVIGRFFSLNIVTIGQQKHFQAKQTMYVTYLVLANRPVHFDAFSFT